MDASDKIKFRYNNSSQIKLFSYLNFKDQDKKRYRFRSYTVSEKNIIFDTNDYE